MTYVFILMVLWHNGWGDDEGFRKVDTFFTQEQCEKAAVSIKADQWYCKEEIGK